MNCEITNNQEILIFFVIGIGMLLFAISTHLIPKLFIKKEKAE